LKDDLSFDMYLQNENRVKSKDEVSFSLIDVPLYDGSDKTKKIVCNLRKLKSGTIKLEKVIADNA
jgi:predicted nucleotidyltransferase